MSASLWLYDGGEGVQGPVGEDEILKLSQSGELAPDSRVREYGPSGSWGALSNWSPGGFKPDQVTVQGAWTDRTTHPWRRYFARALDITIIGTFTWMLIGVVFYTLAPFRAEEFFNTFLGAGGGILDILLTVAVSIPGIALMVGLTGTSIGKWIFGVKIVGKDGRPIGVLKALRREGGVWLIGMGCGMPLISLIATLMAYNRLQDKRSTAWDDDVGSYAFHRPAGPRQTFLIFVGAAVLLIARVWLFSAEQQ